MSLRYLPALILAAVCCAQSGVAQDGPSSGPAATQSSTESTAQLLDQLRAHEARIKELEEKLAALVAKQKEEADSTTGNGVAPAEAAIPVAQPPEPPAEHEHTIQLPGGGPALKIRGFADFNMDFGPVANSLIFPLPSPVHNSFQFGEFDLFLSSKLSPRISFVSEIIYGSDASNEWGLDIERLQLTYKVNPYFQVSGGRYHTSIGYYNTTFHHGTWFQTATGRPFMYYFEDSGGILPIHGVGITSTGLVPGTGRLGLHWIAEVSNGRTSDPDKAPVQNFLSDKDHKAFNVAAYIKPQWLSGLQVGGSFYRDRFTPPGIPHVDQDISSLYVVYNNGTWELMNEGVLISNHPDGASGSFHSPLAYVQLSRKFGAFRPYTRFQYVNVPAADPLNIFKGRYDGPSIGLRMDFTEYAALKVQYNRIYQRDVSAQDGLDMQVAFTF